jgi:hypothetical protein
MSTDSRREECYVMARLNTLLLQILCIEQEERGCYFEVSLNLIGHMERLRCSRAFPACYERTQTHR